MNFSDFSLGQYVSFVRRFDHEDYGRFLALSEDANPLHSDESYARGSEYGERIVPLAMAVSPFSAIAGMALPGVPSVILSQDYVARLPVFFDRDLVYSARIENLSPSQRTIGLSLRVFDGSEKLVEGRITVKARCAEWKVSENVPGKYTVHDPDRTALVTGATGAIGQHCATRLENAGWRVIRHGRRGSDEEILVADFNDPASCADFVEKLEAIRPALVVHCASAGVTDGLSDLIASNFEALSTISSTVLPGMCARQSGRFIVVGSVVQRQSTPDLYAYGAAKVQAGWLLGQIQQRFRSDGIEIAEVLCDKVETEFSEGLSSVGGIVLDPEEVAEHLVYLAERPFSEMSGTYLLTGAGLQDIQSKPGQAAVSDDKPTSAVPPPAGLVAHDAAKDNQIYSKLKTIFDLHLPSSRKLSIENLTMQDIPGWDSLKQIVLALEVEKAFGVSLASAEISGLTTFQDFYSSIQSALEAEHT